MADVSVPAREFTYQLSCDVNLEVAVRVCSVDLFDGAGGAAWASARALARGAPQHLYVSAQLLSGQQAAHLVRQATHSCEVVSQRALWGEWVVLPVRYSDLQRDARVVLSVWSARDGLVGSASVRLFDALGRLRRGRVQLSVEPGALLGATSCPLSLMDSTAAGLDSEHGRIWLMRERFHHDEVQRLTWLDQHAHERTREISADLALWDDSTASSAGARAGASSFAAQTAAEAAAAAAAASVAAATAAAAAVATAATATTTPSAALELAGETDIGSRTSALKPLLTVELPYFEFPVLFEERAYYSETMDALSLMRRQQQAADEQQAAPGARAWTARAPLSKASPRHPGSALPQFPWEQQPVMVHDPEATYAQGRSMEVKESLNPAEEKYRKLNPSLVRGVVDRFLKPNRAERELIYEVIHQPSGNRLNRKMQDLLWKFSFSLTSDKKALIKFVMSVDWDNASEARQAEELLGLWAPIDIADALRLLGDEPEFRRRAVRAHAIKILDQASDSELLLYLLQLVQALRYDDVQMDEASLASASAAGAAAAAAGGLVAPGPGAAATTAAAVATLTAAPVASPAGSAAAPVTASAAAAVTVPAEGDWQPGLLARFLIRRAITSESLVSFFTWYLSTEVEHKESGWLFGRVHGELLAQLRRSLQGRLLAAQLTEQSIFVKKLMSMGKEGRGRAATRQTYLQRMLKQPDGKYRELCHLHVPVMHPLWPRKRVVAVDPDSLRVFNSKTQPIRLDLILESAPEMGGPLSLGSSGSASTAGSLASASASTSSAPTDVAGSSAPAAAHGSASSVTQPSSERAAAMFKVGDDLRQDQLVLQLLGVMDKMFKDVNLNLHLTLYRVLSFSNDEGAMEFVEGSMSLSQVQKNHGSISNYFKKQARELSLRDADEKRRLAATAVTAVTATGGDPPPAPALAQGGAAADSSTFAAAHARARTEREIHDEMVARFIKSCAGYCMCTYILCVGDRHLDNILIREDGALFHIDFGYILGHDPRSWAVGPIRLTRDMIDAMGGRGSPGFDKFISHCCQAYRVLRSKSSLILNLLYLMKDSKIENLFDDHETVIQIVRDRFELNRTDESAEIWLLDKLNKCEDTFITAFSDTLHNTGLYFN